MKSGNREDVMNGLGMKPEEAGKSPYQIVLVDDHSLFREGVRKILSERNDLEVVGEAGDGFELLEILKKSAPDLVILDISMPKLRGLEVIREIRTTYSDVAILILSMHKEYLYYAINAGARGYLLKDDGLRELFRAIEQIRHGKPYISDSFSEELTEDWVDTCRGKRKIQPSEVLTDREREVVKLVAEGKKNKEIADLLYISPRTVEHHRTNILRKLNLKKTADLIRYAFDKGYLDGLPQDLALQ
jgi:DNA-binding NarL/FixJ family response regulator